ncbi:peptide ABC transporter substrate-binding protein [Melghirimyces algeriensis]|uniref:Oligopeptide transport system substrate-binding protein n=1 Tax=Melghirimyces algeriensis TaxID=910412 RepID=A0A521EGF8_9BACL|nr:peptide ABC transporter substrate-binding protein [Melghirimyces algeriensis]SMO82978.1 oligopeptide transport system substrate-binding protein [Melghirimyces algeriensis]
MGKKFTMTLALLLVASMVLTACGGGQSAGGDKQVLNITETGEPPGLDSAVTTDQISFDILNNVTEGLYRVDKNNQPQPAIAKDVEISKDKKTYTFKLRDAKWSDGKPVKAQDFEYAWKRALDPKSKSQYAYILYPIKGAEEYNTDKGDKKDVGVKALDDKTLEVKLNDPIPYFLTLTTFATYRPQREDIVEKHGKEYAQDPDKMVYNGPFVMSEWKHKKSFQLKKNDKYWDKDAVKLDEINANIVKETSTEVNLYNTKKADVINVNGEFVDKYKDSKELVKVPEASNFYFQFNTKEKVFSNEKIRKAFSLAIERKTITEKVTKDGVPAQGIVPITLDVNGKNYREQAGNMIEEDEEKAKKLLEEGLEELDMDKMPSIELLGYDRENAKKTQEYMKERLKNVLGVNVEIKIVPFKQKLDLENAGDFQLSFAGWGADYNDPMTFLELWVTGNPYNRGDWSNKEYDKLIKKSQTNADYEERAKDLIKAEKIAMDEAALAPLYDRQRLKLQKPYVKGIARHPFGADNTYKWAYIEGK